MLQAPARYNLVIAAAKQGNTALSLPRARYRYRRFLNLAHTPQPSICGCTWNERDENQKTREQLYKPPLHFTPISLQRSCFHSTSQTENVSLALILGSVAMAAKGAQLGLRAYNEWQESNPEASAESETSKQAEEGTKQGDAKSNTSTKSAQKEEGQRENIFKAFFGMGVGSKYYEGGFEDKMTRREAALILGVRESASAQRIKNAHRKILILNHPDTGGSTYIASKVNEAKELLLKGKE